VLSGHATRQSGMFALAWGDDRSVATAGREPGEAWMMSTPMIKGELQFTAR